MYVTMADPSFSAALKMTAGGWNIFDFKNNKINNNTPF